MKLNKKKFIKWILSLFALFLLIAIVGLIMINQETKSIYGGETEVVDHQQFQLKPEKFIVENVNLLSENGDSLIKNQSILIEDGMIKAIDTLILSSSDVNIIDGTGKYLIPGLIDAHVHLLESKNDLLLYVANGITQVREMIGAEHHLEWRNQIENGRLGPKLFVASPRLGTFGTMEGKFMEFSQWYLNVTNSKQAKKMVQELYEDGYDGIKVYSQLNKECYEAVVNKANELGMPVMGHIAWDITIDDLYKNGQKGIAHFEELANALKREFKEKNNIPTTFEKEDEFLEFLKVRGESLAKDLKTNNITVTSTLWLAQSFEPQKFELENVLKQVQLQYENPGISEWSKHVPDGIGWLPLVNRYKIRGKLSEEGLEKEKKYWYTYGLACKILGRILHKNGVKIMAGTDANLPPVVPGFSLHNELEVLESIDMTNPEILKSATAIPASFLGTNTGVIKVGYEANLVLLDKNPLEDISNTKAINTVILRGSIIERTMLDDILNAVEQANNNSRTVDIDKYL
ncbi:amidohydrolase family protein [Aquimarina rubra]|uniref:Amidohydrolase family protein n=1 Tax=Aquimarina rubra TaxID=1920033 RepID=A0ABW5LB59_9FLAO